jgi:hypothetical protein
MGFSLNSTDKSIIVGLKAAGGASDATGLTLTDLTISVTSAAGTVTSSAANALGSTDAVHNDYGMFEKSAGLFRLDLPDSTFTALGEQYIKVSGAAVETAISIVNVANQVPSETLNDYKADVSGIPTNTLLTNDARLDNLDAPIGTVQTTVDALNDISVAQVLAGLNAESYDGKTFTELMTGLRALSYGSFTVSGVGTGTLTVALKNASGATLASFSVSESTGARTAL